MTTRPPGYLPGVSRGIWHVVLGLRTLPQVVQSSELTCQSPLATARITDLPSLPRSGGQGESLLTLAETGLVLVAGDNRRHVISVEGESVAAPRDRGPYRLENADRTTLALCQ